MSRFFLILAAMVQGSKIMRLGVLGWITLGGIAQAAALTPRDCTETLSSQGFVKIQAVSQVSAFYCWGRLHARDRGVQMRTLRATAYGRLAEQEGFSRLRGDFFLRTLEFEARARKIASELSDGDRALLDAYRDGVNAGGAGFSGNFAWHSQDTLALLLLQAFDQTRRSFQQDIVMDRESRAGNLLKAAPPWQTTILKPGEYSRVEGAQRPFHDDVRDDARYARRFSSPEETIAHGSNNWVVAPRFTRGGHALLANDPHLALRSPSFWHWVAIEWGAGSNAHRIAGAVVPGVPLIASGASRFMSWGLTNSYVDVADAVLVDQKELASHTRRERPWIWFRWMGLKIPFFFKSYEVTTFGQPILPIESPEKETQVVLRWSGLDLKAQDFSALWSFSQARTVAEMDQELSRVGVPSWNFVFADVQGGIGYRVVGKIPSRAGAQISGPGLAHLKFDELASWPMLEPHEIPHLVNPARGWVVTANHAQWGGDARFSVGTAQTQSFRGYRIEELLTDGLSRGRSRVLHDVESFRKIQCDVQAVDARFLIPRLLKNVEAGSPGVSIPREGLQTLRDWNFEAGRDCKACALFRLWMNELGEPEWLNAKLDSLEAAPRSADQEILDALVTAYNQLLSLGEPFRAWGERHFAPFPGTSVPRPLTRASDREWVSTPGDEHSVNPGSADFDGSTGVWRQHSGASQRMVVEMSTPPRIFISMAGTNDETARPNFEAWRDCRLTEWK